MAKIRINDLARELEVKSKSVLDYLHEIGVADVKSHSSAVEDDIAERVRTHFHSGGDQEAAPPEPRRATPRPPAAAPAPSTPGALAHDTIKITEPRPEPRALSRTIAEIKADARKSLTPLRPAPAEKPTAHGPLRPSEVAPGIHAPAGAPALPKRPGVAPPAKPAALRPPIYAPGKPSEPAAARPAATREAPAGAKTAEAPASAAAKTARTGRPAKSPASNQPIYPVGGIPHPGVPRTYVQRRPGEPRPMHPTASRPVPLAGAGGAAPALRHPAGRAPGLAPRWSTPGPRVPPPRPIVLEDVPITRKITISEGITVKELSEKLDARAKDVIKRLLDKGLFATINQTLDGQIATDISRGFGAETEVVTYEEEVLHEVEEADRVEDLVARAPVVTVMGHVDHGKTSLLDAIRETNVTAGEAGGITQHIGAYQVEAQNRKIVFLDTPGHEAFTLMRARGAKVTDIVVLVVAADDGVMPQTLEAINHARAAKVPVVVAINKVDKPEAMPDRVRKQLSEHNLLAEAWGGDTVMVEVSAKQKANLQLLLEMVLLVADLQALKANPKRLASGTVLESKLDRGRGPVASILVQNGTLRVGDSFIVGAIFGKVRAMFDYRGRPIVEAPPSTPVEVLGLEDVPQVGDRLQVIEDALKARQISLHRLAKLREAALAKSSRLTLEQLHQQLAAGDVKDLPLIIKGDVQGSAEVLNDTLSKLSNDKVKVKIIHTGVGAITETDVLLASASNAVIVGFNVRPERKASELAQLENVDIRLHTIIYNVTDEIKKAMTGLLAVTYKETTLGRAEVRETFRIPKVGTVAGCYVQDGKVSRESKIRLLRDNVVVHEGKVRSLRRFKEDVTEVKSGMECGVALENFNDVKIGDVVESFVVEKVTEPVPV